MIDGVTDMTEELTQEEQAAISLLENSWNERGFLDLAESVIIRRRTPKALFLRLLESFKMAEEMTPDEWRALERAVVNGRARSNPYYT
jgi:hypothetical protein